MDATLDVYYCCLILLSMSYNSFLTYFLSFMLAKAYSQHCRTKLLTETRSRSATLVSSSSKLCGRRKVLFIISSVCRTWNIMISPLFCFYFIIPCNNIIFFSWMQCFFDYFLHSYPHSDSMYSNLYCIKLRWYYNNIHFSPYINSVNLPPTYLHLPNSSRIKIALLY